MARSPSCPWNPSVVTRENHDNVVKWGSLLNALLARPRDHAIIHTLIAVSSLSTWRGIRGLADLRKDGTNVCNTRSGFPWTNGNQLLGAEEEAQLCGEAQVTCFQLCNLQILMKAFVGQQRTVKDLPIQNIFWKLFRGVCRY